MEIYWHGETCFTIKGANASIVINPHEGVGKLKGDIVLSSLEKNEEVENMGQKINWPGEYEIKEVLISATKVDNTLVFCFKMEGIRFCHLGEIENIPDGEIVKKIGDIDILMIGLGGDSKLDSKKGLETTENIDPKIIIPMESASPIASLKNIGIENAEELEKLEIKSASDLPVDKTRYVALNMSL
jgi:L-ascorbate metabolism protein UlaG (beta-lactamase superfamily)